MLVTWKYLPRDTVVQRFSPRARLIFSGCLLFAVVPVWDLRVLAGLLALAAGQFWLARIGFWETRRFWSFLVLLLVFLSLITLVTGRGGEVTGVGGRVMAR